MKLAGNASIYQGRGKLARTSGINHLVLRGLPHEYPGHIRPHSGNQVETLIAFGRTVVSPKQGALDIWNLPTHLFWTAVNSASCHIQRVHERIAKHHTRGRAVTRIDPRHLAQQVRIIPMLGKTRGEMGAS